MNNTPQNAELREAIYELHRYFSDEMAPLMVTDSVQLLLQQPPQLVATEIHGWVGHQSSRQGADFVVSDFLYHAMKKIHLLSEFDLIQPERLKAYLQEVASHVLNCCPEEDRESLRDNLQRLDEVDPSLGSGAVEQVYRQGGSAAKNKEAAATGTPAAGNLTAADASAQKGLRRFAALLQRLGKPGQATALTGAGPAANDLKIQALTTAATHSRTEADLQQYLQELGQVGVDSRTNEMFRMLSQNLPAWQIPASVAKEMEDSSRFSSRSAEAMHQIVALADTPEEASHRYNDLLNAAIEQFNEGYLARAATMLNLAERLVRKKRVQADTAQTIRKRLRDNLSDERLRRYAENQESHAQLLRVMNFFPSLSVDGLLEQLRNEDKRERRKQVLTLLEVYGLDTRLAVLDELESYMAGDVVEEHGYYLRNLVYLLRRVPVAEEGPGAKELEFLTQLSETKNHWIVIRETIRALGRMGHPAAEQLLRRRLHEFEQAALAQGEESGKTQELHDLLDYTISALASLGTVGAYRAAVEHGLREEPALGNTAARLEELGLRDLSERPDQVTRLLNALKDKLPKKILGFVLRKSTSLHSLVRALSGTPLPAVEAAFKELAVRFPKQELGEEATKALERLAEMTRRKGDPPPSLSGDIELFGLPSLLQSLGDSRLTGTLTLRDAKGDVCGTLAFEGGKIGASKYLQLEGEMAVFQLFEKPGPRTFAFRGEPGAPPEDWEAAGLLDVLPTMLEAVRRHDEYRQAQVLVPDGSRLEKTGTKPSRLADEEDMEFIRALWMRATAGATPEECEDNATTDAYRVRRLLSHWVEAGALQAVGTQPQQQSTLST